MVISEFRCVIFELYATGVTNPFCIHWGNPIDRKLGQFSFSLDPPLTVV